MHCIVFIHLYSASHSMSLSEALLITIFILCRSYHVEALQATASEGFAQVPTWRLECDSNLKLDIPSVFKW